MENDALSHILAYLPVKSIIKLRATNKYLTSSTSNEFFFLCQSKKYQVDSGFFITKSYSSQIFFFDPHSGIPNESKDLVEKTPNILASSNGLVFCKTENESTKNMYYYNLVHKKRCIVPSNLGDHNLCEIEYLGLQVLYYGDMSVDYKLVCVIPNEEWSNVAHVRIFDSRRNAWIKDKKTIDLGPRSVDLESSVALGINTIFWVSDCKFRIEGSESYILAFDAESEKSWFISIPKEIAFLDSHIVKIAKKDEETLCLVRFSNADKRFTIWETKQIGESGQIFQVINSVSVAEMVRCENENVIISTFGLMRGGDVLDFVKRFNEI